MLSEHERRHLMEWAELCVQSGKGDEAIECYERLSKDEPTNPYYYTYVARILREKHTAQDAAAGIIYASTAIWWGQDDAYSYLLRGTCYAVLLNCQKDMTEEEREEIAERIIADYKEARRRKPADPLIWLGILERYVADRKWDDAISCYGQCGDLIRDSNDKNKLVRAWLGCLAFIFAGDEIKDVDKQSIFDNTIRFEKHTWNVTEIESLLIDLQQQGVSRERLDTAKEYHRRFLSHFEGDPLRCIPP